MVFNLPVKKESKWKFKTNATGGVGLGIVTGSGGLIELTTLDDGYVAFYHFGGLGVGYSLGGKLPKIPKLPKIDLKEKSGAGSSTDFTSTGTVYVMEACKTDDLTADDFQDPCIFIDAGAGVIAGYSGTAMLAGISPMTLIKAGLIAGAMFNPMAVAEVMNDAKALILMRGWNVGLQIGGGVSASLGYLHLSKIVDAKGDCINNAKGFCEPATN